MKVIKVFVIFLILFLTPFMVGAQCPDSIVVNFDNDSCSGWTTDKLTAPSSTTWACGRPDKNVINGTPSNYNAWVNGDTTGIYDADEKSYVISPIYDFSCIQDPYLAIDIWWEVEDTWDGAAIQYSLDSGSTWKDIGDKGDSNCITRNWYNEDSVNRLETNNSDGWSGHDSSTTGSCSAEGNGSGQWVTAQHCLSGLGGEPDVQFRVIFGAGGICQCEGFAFDNFKILEPDRPSVTIDQSNPAICKGDSISLTTTTSTCGNSYLWNTGASSDTLRVSPAKDSTYSVTVTKTQCTKNRYDTASVTVTVDTQVTAGIMAPDSVCPGDSATLTGVGAPQYVWNTGATTSSIEVLPADSATYWVKGKNGLCKDTARDTIYHHAQPTATVSGVDSICSTDTTTLTASGGIDYTWSNGDTTSSVDVSPNNTTLYTVTVANAASCRDTAHYEVAADTAVTVQVSGVDSICPGDTAQLSAQGAPAYRWVTGATTKSIDASPNNDSAYWVVGNNGLCEDTAEHTLSLHPSPTAAVSGVDSICSTDTTTLTASGGVDYTWSNGGTTSSVDVSPNSTTQYTVTVANAASCQDTAHYEVAADTAVTVQVSGVDSICPGDTAQLSAQGAPAYRWVTGATKKSIDASPNNDSTYWVVGNNGLCQDSAFKTLGVSSSISATVSGPDSICKGHTATLVAGGGTAFEWSTGTTKDTLLITSMKDTAYWLRATSASCFDTIFDTLKVTPDISTNIMGVDSICEWY